MEPGISLTSPEKGRVRKLVFRRKFFSFILALKKKKKKKKKEKKMCLIITVQASAELGSLS